MDIVDTFNHLIPSDQLDDSLITGQNLECEASNEFGTGLHPKDSLKNMLSDKDPMFGCASSQFNLLENEDSTFQIAGSTGMSTNKTDEYSAPQPASASTNIMTRGRPGRKPANRLQKSFLIKKGVKGTQLKKELSLGGRINVNDLDGGSWLKPTVVLRRLTVTIGGFRIELLPGPSYTQNDTNQPACFDDGISYSKDNNSSTLPDEAVNVQNPVPENVAEMDVIEKSSSDDAALGLGPYVNPNDVQTTNGALTESPCMKETKLDNQSDNPGTQSPANKGKEDIKLPQNNESKSSACNKTDDKEKQQIVAKNLLKSKKGLTPKKNKDLISCKPGNIIKEDQVSQNTPSKNIQRDLQKTKSLKEKKDITPLKRPAENTQCEHATKVQKIQGTGEGKVKSKIPNTPSSLVKKSPSSGNRVGDQQGPTKPTHPHNSSKVETAHPTHSRPGPSLKTAEDDGQEKPKLKKPEKLLQKQKSKNSRSISVDEPQLFIPDNAPVVKKETAEEQSGYNEPAWDGNNCCGLCKKHHNNMFMVGCGRCDDWFHGDCVGLDLMKVREMEEQDQMYVCLKCCEEESKKVEPEPPSTAQPEIQAKTEVQDHKLPPKPRPGPSQTLASGATKFYINHHIGVHVKQETKSKPSSSASKKPVSAEAVRRNVRDSLKEILIQRLKDSDLNISVERASEVAKKTERELFHLYKDTDNKYKNKYRSLMFNLKDTKNNVLFKRVLKGEISPGNLIRMSPEELASKELAAWRQRENRHTIEMIEKEQREAERRPITKITHKGEIEIESQEPLKAPEPAELEPPPKVIEVSAEPVKTSEKKAESTNTEKDTTSQHKSHLFDLHCKICTGRMAPPVEEVPTKVVKVATTVVRRQSTKAEEMKSTTPPATDDDLHHTVLEESFRNAQPGYEARSAPPPPKHYEEAAFLSNLKSLWRGFIHMCSVAKLVTKAFPVSGVLDNLTEDLPQSIQVGGRISPQTVWDYLEKIRATGTKEVCLIRFSPETEEDEISYTLLYAYFSSRRRFGVVSNNLKQVKDMYLIPLGATEKVPHQLVPFDGPGLENNRANLLLGLIIRQRPKRDFLPVDMNETARIVPEIKPITISTKETRATEEEEKFFLASLSTAHKKEKDKPLNTTEDVDVGPVTETFEKPSESKETSNQESQKPLRFLPGVLVGWGGELPPLPDVGDKPATTTDVTQKIQKTEASSANLKSPVVATPRERFVIKKKEAKPPKAEPELSSLTDASAANSSSVKDAAVVPHGGPLSLKDKPPDVSTEAFLASLPPAPSGSETSITSSANKGDVRLFSETAKGTSEGNSLLQPKSQAALDHTSSSKPPLSGILKKSSAYSSLNEEKIVVLQKDKASLPISIPKPVPALSSTRNDAAAPFHQGCLQLSQAKNKPEEQHQTGVQPVPSEKEEPAMSQAGAVVTPAVCSPTAQGPQATPSLPVYDSTSAPLQQQQPQVPGSYTHPTGPPPDTFPTPPTQDKIDTTPWGQDSTSHTIQSQYSEGYSQPSDPPPSQAKDLKREERYSDPWERPRNTEDRDHHGRHSHHRDSHHGKKSRHHDREKKHERSYDDKYRERSRHHGHSDDRYGEKRKERHHSDDYSSRHKDRHRHRRDSDYENGRRSSKDSYS
uniref:PHD finger protein 3 n=1 Tax=Mastacembelus armatus TaxID=205130 RepID=A0A7N8XWL8_9TELE